MCVFTKKKAFFTGVKQKKRQQINALQFPNIPTISTHNFCALLVCFYKSLKSRNIVLLVASYVFYGWWDYRFLSLILASTLVDYLVALSLEKENLKQYRNILLSISLIFNLGLLGIFKYYNFFIESWVDAWASAGVTMQTSTLSIILPVGISFYTFQTLSYTIDVYSLQIGTRKIGFNNLKII